MHTISNERALAHWQALNRLPVAAMNHLRTRFLNEQPLLASVALPLTDGLDTAPDGQERLPDIDDPKLDDFRRIATTGAIMNEILCREAGRPLRKLEEQEVLEIAEACARLFEQLGKEAGQDKAGQLNVFTTSSQRYLLTGAVIAHSIDVAPDRVKLPREVLNLRILAECLHRACGDEPATNPRCWDAQRIQFALATQGDPLRREALEAAEGFRAKLMPDLISELEWWAAEPNAALAQDGSLGMHAMFLLAKWREDSAWLVFRKLFSLPGDIGYDLLGDLITEDGPILLAMVSGKRRDELRAMVEDEKLDEYCRNACLDALTCLVAWGELPRGEHIAWLQALLTGKLRDVRENEHTFGGVVSTACDLEAGELRREIEAAYERGVVDDGFIDLKFFLDCQAGKHRRQWQAFVEGHQQINDVAAATKWLDEPPRMDEPLPPVEDDPAPFVDSSQPYIAPPKVGRNDPCPCGSGKKYKKCCGA